MSSIIVGIDPGSHTGYAAWDTESHEFSVITTLKAWEAIWMVQQLHHAKSISGVVIEDARLRTWFGTKGREALQGAGAIKRECTLWSEMLGDNGIPFLSVKPAACQTKYTAEAFARLTGWTGRTSEHARDAALLVWGRTMKCAVPA